MSGYPRHALANMPSVPPRPVGRSEPVQTTRTGCFLASPAWNHIRHRGRVTSEAVWPLTYRLSFAGTARSSLDRSTRSGTLQAEGENTCTSVEECCFSSSSSSCSCGFSDESSRLVRRPPQARAARSVATSPSGKSGVRATSTTRRGSETRSSVTKRASTRWI